MYYKVWNEIDKGIYEIRTCIQPLDRPTGKPQGDTLNINEQDLAEITYTLFSKGPLSFMKLLEQKGIYKEQN